MFKSNVYSSVSLYAHSLLIKPETVTVVLSHFIVTAEFKTKSIYDQKCTMFSHDSSKHVGQRISKGFKKN